MHNAPGSGGRTMRPCSILSSRRDTSWPSYGSLRCGMIAHAPQDHGIGVDVNLQDHAIRDDVNLRASEYGMTALHMYCWDSHVHCPNQETHVHFHLVRPEQTLQQRLNHHSEFTSKRTMEKGPLRTAGPA
eukprot:1160281-Pelagomonas_calceolata.AAC.6